MFSWTGFPRMSLSLMTSLSLGAGGVGLSAIGGGLVWDVTHQRMVAPYSILYLSVLISPVVEELSIRRSAMSVSLELP